MTSLSFTGGAARALEVVTNSGLTQLPTTMRERFFEPHTPAIAHRYTEYPLPQGVMLRGHHWAPADGQLRTGGGAKLLVFLHGLGNCADCFVRLGSELARRGYIVHAPSMPGHGWRPEITSGPRPGAFQGMWGNTVAIGETLLYLWQREQIAPEDTMLIGHSLGGMEAQLLLSPLFAQRIRQRQPHNGAELAELSVGRMVPLSTISLYRFDRSFQSRPITNVGGLLKSMALGGGHIFDGDDISLLLGDTQFDALRHEEQLEIIAALRRTLDHDRSFLSILGTFNFGGIGGERDPAQVRAARAGLVAPLLGKQDTSFPFDYAQTIAPFYGLERPWVVDAAHEAFFWNEQPWADALQEIAETPIPAHRSHRSTGAAQGSGLQLAS